MAGVMALLFITAIFITFKIFRVHKLREAEKYHNPKFLKHLQNIDEFVKNAYYILLTRAIYGQMVYVEDDKLRDFLLEIFSADQN